MASLRERGARWLRGELPTLVASGTISAETARALEQYYAPKEGESRNTAFIVLATIGSALVAAGIILLIAHNWDELSRATRSVIAFLPLIAAQLLTAFVLMRRDDSRPWREAASIFNVAAIGTAIALISQTYQIHGSFANFVLTWMLLSIPLVYLMRTTLGAITYVIGSIVWITSHHSPRYGSGPLAFWLLVLLVVPYVVAVYRRERSSHETTVLCTILAIALGFGLGFTAEYTHAHIGVLAFAGLFAATYICGIELFPESERDRLHPLTTFGAIAIGGMAVVFTFEELWRFSYSSSVPEGWARSLGVIIQLLFPLAALALAAWSFVRRTVHFSILAAALPVVAAIGWGLTRSCALSHDDHCSFAAALLFDVYAFALGVELIARGLRADSTARTNFGLIVIAALAVARFFDSDLSFVVRAVGFIVIGLGFLFTNLVLFKKRRPA